MSGEINLDYADVLKAYQTKSGELLTQLITAEAKLNASAGVITTLKNKISELESENQKLQKSSNRIKKSATDNVVDYNS
jgi:CII-binding regulator of phage lambda lysogenization HflD